MKENFILSSWNTGKLGETKNIREHCSLTFLEKLTGYPRSFAKSKMNLSSISKFTRKKNPDTFTSVAL